ncbi:hypothetical protein D3C75_747290 [compost metagenome]
MAVALGFQIIKGQLDLLIVLVHRVNQTAGRFALQGEDIAFAIRIQLEVTAAECHFLVAALVAQRFQGDIGAGVTGIADAGVHHERGFILRQIVQRLRGFVVHQGGFNRGHRRDQVEGFQLGQRERAMIDLFVQDNALARLQPRAFGAGQRFNHQLQMAGEHAALIVLIAQFEPGFFDFAICLSHHLGHAGFQLFPGKPGSTCPDHA